MYTGGKLLFADHIFNGYGNAKKDFLKQVWQSIHLISYLSVLRKHVVSFFFLYLLSAPFILSFPDVLMERRVGDAVA